MQRNTAKKGKKISWIRIICLHSCLIVEAKVRVSGLEDGVQDVLVVGGDVEQMPFEDGKITVYPSKWDIIFICYFSKFRGETAFGGVNLLDKGCHEFYTSFYLPVVRLIY